MILAVIFYFANVPDIKGEDDYHLDDPNNDTKTSGTPDREVDRGTVYFLLVFNAAVMIGICGMIAWLFLSVFKIEPTLVKWRWAGPWRSLSRR